MWLGKLLSVWENRQFREGDAQTEPERVRLFIYLETAEKLRCHMFTVWLLNQETGGNRPCKPWKMAWKRCAFWKFLLVFLFSGEFKNHLVEYSCQWMRFVGHAYEGFQADVENSSLTHQQLLNIPFSSALNSFSIADRSGGGGDQVGGGDQRGRGRRHHHEGAVLGRGWW